LSENKKGHKLYEKALALEYAGTNAPDVVAMLKAAKKEGSVEATYALGTLFLHGKHVEKDGKKAFKLFKTAAKSMHREALYDLAISYETGDFVEKDEQKAFQHYVLSMVAGERQSSYEVARCFFYGIGTEKNEAMYDLFIKAHKKLMASSED
jgi:TPR repeat protein